MRRHAALLATIALTLLAMEAGPTTSRGAESPAAAASVGPLAGVVVDGQGQPASDAKVWLHCFY